MKTHSTTPPERNTMTPRIPAAGAALLALMLALSGCGSSAPGSKAAPLAEEHEETGHDEAGHEEEGHEAEEGRVHLTPEQVTAAALGMATAGPADIRESLSVYGTIAPNAERMREVGARFPGVIVSVEKKIGDSVRLGETLATVESNESLRTYPVTAPLTGIVTLRNAYAGEQTGEHSLFTVADLSTVWVELSLFPRDRARVSTGQQVRVRSVDAGLTGQGEVVYVAPFGSSASQTLTARVQLPNAEQRWAPGLYVSADIVLSQVHAKLAIRNEAVQTIDGRNSVFVEEEPGEFVPHPLRLGRTDGEISEVLDGIEAGQRYVTVNSFILKAQMGAGSAEHGH
jgi:cobalt-zinc-cadmium efflux system membrane fusion protein